MLFDKFDKIADIVTTVCLALALLILIFGTDLIDRIRGVEMTPSEHCKLAGGFPIYSVSGAGFENDPNYYYCANEYN